MLKIAIVENDVQDAELLTRYIKQYEKEAGISADVSVFEDGELFLLNYKTHFDIVFMDIKLVGIDGPEAARRLRAIDQEIVIVFVTSMAQYAIKGYEVNAFDFLVKPVSYELFRIKLDKVREHTGRRNSASFAVQNAGVMRMVPLAEIKYVESVKHYLFFHTRSEELKMRASLGDIKPLFKANGFAEVNRSLLVNLAYVEGYTPQEIVVSGEKLPLSRVYKAEFLNALTRFVGNGGTGVSYDSE